LSHTEKILLEGYEKEAKNEKDKYEQQLFEIALLRSKREVEQNKTIHMVGKWKPWRK